MVRGENVELVKELSKGYRFLSKLDEAQEEVQTKVRVVCRNSLNKLAHLDLDPEEDSHLWRAKNKAWPLLQEVLSRANTEEALQTPQSIRALITLALDALDPFCALAEGNIQA